MISIIIVGRNDNYGGDFEGRLFETVGYNAEQLRERDVQFEIVFVEWNPLTDRPLLSESVADTFAEARCFAIDEAVHRLISRNRHIKVHEYHAKNAGVRRSLGDWLLITNPDNFLDDEILAFLAADQFEQDALVRAGRINIASKDKMGSRGPNQGNLDDPPPYIHASGDFIFCSRRLFDRVGGFREDLPFTVFHKDAIFCHTCADITPNIRKIGATYHLKHNRDGADTRRLNYDWSKVPRVPQITYGLECGCIETEIAPRIVRVSLPDQLAQDTADWVPPEPSIPVELRLPEIETEPDAPTRKSLLESLLKR